MNRGDRIYMKQQSIASLKTLFAAGNVTAENILALKLDERKGVQQLIATYAKKQQQAAKLADDFYEMGSYERQSLRSEEHTSELQSRGHLVCRLLLEKKK